MRPAPTNIKKLFNDEFVEAVFSVTEHAFDADKLREGLRGRIAAALSASPKTIDTHRSHIVKKLRLRNNSDITRFAIEHGLMPV